MTGRRFLVPEVVQTSGMDCGPAALTCLLGGFGIRASYGRLREACQTEVDGTSIDTLEDTARLLGLAATQVMARPERIAAEDSGLLPAIVITTLPGGLLHFVVVWRRHGAFLQIMDPAVGRRWVRADRFLDEVYVHQMHLPPQDLDQVPDFVTVEPDGRLLARGAVLVRVTGPSTEPVDTASLPAELRAALTEPPARPLAELTARVLRTGGPARIAALGLVAVAAAAGVIVETLLFQGIIDAPDSQGGRFAALAIVAMGLLVLDAVLATSGAALGRRLDGGLRRALFRRLPLLPDRYLRSRPTSDLAERAHRLHQLRDLPALGAELVRALAELVAVTAAIAWLAPDVAAPAVLCAVITIVAAAVSQPALSERDLRLRSHAGALARFFLDGMLGLVAVRAHAAERVVAAEHDGLLAEWARTARALARAAVTTEAVQRLAGVAAAAWIVWGVSDRAATRPGTFLLLTLWAVTLPVIGDRLAQLARQWPWHRNVMLRFLEPLAAGPADRETAADLPGTGGVAIDLRRVSVVAGGHLLLHEVDLRIAGGERVAVVGAAGAGKSSLIGTLLGWLAPVSGRILVDGRPLDPVALRAATAWVDPNVQLWNTSLAANLRYGNEGDPARVIAAAELGDVLDGLRRRPAGADTPLGEGGGLLSGGEGQRVRLGRALLRRGVRLALLDEPFRGLDREQRRRLLGRVLTAWPGATMLMVTHDVGDTLAFDRVLVVDGGAVVEDGAPAALAADPRSRYRALLDAERAAGFGDDWRHLVVDSGRVHDLEVIR
ncbi:MAG TPA: ATP-binding cassette domain-containing protein [Actinophytocola sp.]|uniref:ATP-binding cassette domain-containing protein n=1 Tax=Actinophytocola sp. TaxID=1872138 RepID=UPI002DDD9570|nr:ATP-binding cassette domain-containing protein [Actinophytocola sp.]HEV2779403.1 ATP-binding cassette domain-containing protein [Actinophytocola sp.]